MSKRKTTKDTIVKPEIAGPGGADVNMEPAYDFSKAIQIWQGAPKVGKTSTFGALGKAAKEAGIEGVNPFLVLFEPGSGGISGPMTTERCSCEGKKGCPDCGGVGSKRKILTTIEEMEEWFNWLAESKYNPLGLDTGDAMFQYVSDAVCRRMGVKAPHEIDHGVAWTDIFNEMRRLLGILMGADKGLIVIMHIYMIERRIKGGGIINTATFNIGGKSQRFLASIANQILHFTIEPGADGADHHVIVSRPRSGVEAGDQWGLLPETIDRGKSPEEGAKSLLSCFYEL